MKYQRSQTIGRRRGYLAACPAIALLGLLSGCGSRETETKTEAPAGAETAVWKPAGNEGSIAGKINFQGQAPKARAISMDADSVCASKHSKAVYPETVVANDNATLRNVFVYVKSGLEGKNFAVPDDAVVLDQDGCVYKPHVLGIQARQTLSVKTSDNTTHNIHPIPKVNREWNVSQPPNADPITQSFSRPEVSIPVKCNQHPWMRAYIHVVSHPYYAVTDDDGDFKIENLPPGDYEIETIHEEYGAQTQKVTVAANGSATADFSYKAGQAYKKSTLTELPALVLHCCSK
jgi:hypothetical protein